MTPMEPRRVSEDRRSDLPAAVFPHFWGLLQGTGGIFFVSPVTYKVLEINFV